MKASRYAVLFTLVVGTFLGSRGKAQTATPLDGVINTQTFKGDGAKKTYAGEKIFILASTAQENSRAGVAVAVITGQQAELNRAEKFCKALKFDKVIPEETHTQFNVHGLKLYDINTFTTYTPVTCLQPTKDIQDAVASDSEVSGFFHADSKVRALAHMLKEKGFCNPETVSLALQSGLAIETYKLTDRQIEEQQIKNHRETGSASGEIKISKYFDTITCSIIK